MKPAFNSEGNLPPGIHNMIRNERQYRSTRAQAANFQKAIQEVGERPARGSNPVLLKAQREALNSQLKDLLAELEEYEALQAGKRPALHLDSIEELPRALIRARI